MRIMAHLPRRLRCWLGDHGLDVMRPITEFSKRNPAQIHEQACFYCPVRRRYLITEHDKLRVL